MYSYTYADFKAELNDMLHNKAGSVSNLRRQINRAVRRNNGKIDFRSTKRYSQTPIGFFNSRYEAIAPTDLKSGALIDIRSIRGSSLEIVRTSPEEFMRRKEISTDDVLVAIDESDRYKKLLINSFGDSKAVQIHSCDAVTGDDSGTWEIVSDASDLVADNWNYLTGSAALRFTTAATTTSVLKNETISPIDLSNYVDKASIFISLYIPTSAAATALTSVGLDFGNNSSNYYSNTATTDHVSIPFRKGWNILKFDWTNTTETGTVVNTAISYLKLTLNKSASAVETSDWRIDNIAMIQSDLNDVAYYSNACWVSQAGTYLQDSTADTDVLIADEDEIELHLLAAAINCAQVIREVQADLPTFKSEYKEEVAQYQRLYKSERKPLITTYQEL